MMTKMQVVIVVNNSLKRVKEGDWTSNKILFHEFRKFKLQKVLSAPGVYKRLGSIAVCHDNDFITFGHKRAHIRPFRN